MREMREITRKYIQSLLSKIVYCRDQTEDESLISEVKQVHLYDDTETYS